MGTARGTVKLMRPDNSCNMQTYVNHIFTATFLFLHMPP